MNDTNIADIVDRLFEDAISEQASDIHIEPQKQEAIIRYRVDGLMKVAHQLDLSIYLLIVSRIKILTELDTTGHPRPQEGKIKFRYIDRDVDLRVSIMPTSVGECIVIRILESVETFSNYSDLGMLDEQARIVNDVIKKPYGLILVTGSNGSGKSTTLFRILNNLNSPEKTIATLEDPVERRMDMLRQTQVDPDIGLTFAAGLRFLMRQDPNIIMVGEIRDKETAQIAVQAAVTGHLVFATIHTNNAAGAIIRLINMEVEPYLISTALKMVTAQRLAREICPDCKKIAEPPAELVKSLNLPKDIKFYEGTGCEKCNGKGFRGRQGIHEILMINRQIQDLILKNPSDSQINTIAKQSGMMSLREAALKKVATGVISLEEALRLTE